MKKLGKFLRRLEFGHFGVGRRRSYEAGENIKSHAPWQGRKEISLGQAERRPRTHGLIHYERPGRGAERCLAYQMP